MRTVLISGASRGIGKAIAEQAVKDGHNISLGIRTKDSLKGSILDPEVNKGSNILITKYDANNKCDASKWVMDTYQYYGQIDTIIHCAGFFRRTKLKRRSRSFSAWS